MRDTKGILQNENLCDWLSLCRKRKEKEVKNCHDGNEEISADDALLY